MMIPDWMWPAAGFVIALLGLLYGRIDKKTRATKEEAQDYSELKNKIGLVLYQMEGINSSLIEIKGRLGNGDARMLSFERRLIRIETHLKLPEMKEE
jgi:hypothetical protein